MVMIKRPKVLVLEFPEENELNKHLPLNVDPLYVFSLEEASQEMGLNNIDAILCEIPKADSEVFAFCKAQFPNCPIIFYTADKRKKCDDSISSVGDLIVKKSEIKKCFMKFIEQVVETRRRERQKLAA